MFQIERRLFIELAQNIWLAVNDYVFHFDDIFIVILPHSE